MTVPELATRLGVSAQTIYAMVGRGEVPEGAYDRVLVDAPCSGIGTLRRRPEILLRRTREDIARLSLLQAAIAQRASLALRPGGALVYAVCSVLAEEMEGVVKTLTGLRLESITRLTPQASGTDGYAIARMTRES